MAIGQASRAAVFPTSQILLDSAEVAGFRASESNLAEFNSLIRFKSESFCPSVHESAWIELMG